MQSRADRGRPLVQAGHTSAQKASGISRPDVARYLLDEPWTAEVTRDKLTERLTKTGIDGERGALALVIEHKGVAIGDVALWLTDHEHRQGEIGWVLDPAHGGRGFASEAVQATLTLGFNHYQLHRITAQMDARSSASAALARRVGLRLEAHHVQNWFSKGEWTDTLVYAQLASEFKPRRRDFSVTTYVLPRPNPREYPTASGPTTLYLSHL